MIPDSWFYGAMEIARILIDGDLPASEQYAFLDYLHATETVFLPGKWRSTPNGHRALLLDVQNTMAYLADKEALEEERAAVEEDGGTLPTEEQATLERAFFKSIRLDMARCEFFGQGQGATIRMKVRTILKRFGIKKRGDRFRWAFYDAAMFYHVGLRSRLHPEPTFDINLFDLDEHIVFERL